MVIRARINTAGGRWFFCLVWSTFMNDSPNNEMLEATRLTREGRLSEATSLLQRLLGKGRGPQSGAAENDRGAFLKRLAGVADWFKPAGDAQRFTSPGAAVESPSGAQFLAASFADHSGTRAYKLYVPSRYQGQRCPLVIMMHGCKQSPDDFAAGTRMNVLAEAETCLIAYPAQTASANASKCWNWFNPADQKHGRGEPALIAGLTRQIAGTYTVDPRRIYIAGLSAGGAAAAVMAMTYPDLYAAVGVHSGLPCGAAHDVQSAFAAMRQTTDARRPVAQRTDGRIVPTIVFHGDADETVTPFNGDQVIRQAAGAERLTVAEHAGRTSEGVRYRRKIFADASGRECLEQWILHGAGHAWSGGSPAGSFTDARGPDASREMLRFFLEHPHG